MTLFVWLSIAWFACGALAAFLYGRERVKFNPYGNEPEGFAYNIGTWFGCAIQFFFGPVSLILWFMA